jgi:hypothetical protein
MSMLCQRRPKSLAITPPPNGLDQLAKRASGNYCEQLIGFTKKDLSSPAANGEFG